MFPPTQLLRSALPKLGRSVPRPIHLTPFLRLPPTPSTSRLLSTSRVAFRPTPSSLPKGFPASSRLAGSSTRGIATAPVARTAGDQVDWTKVATNVGIAAAAALGLNYALNRETRGALTGAESS